LTTKKSAINIRRNIANWGIDDNDDEHEQQQGIIALENIYRNAEQSSGW
jgi:hypothetical protein